MPADFFDPTPDDQNVVLVDAATIRKAEKMIGSCEQCNADDAESFFDNVLDRVTGNNPAVTDYVLEAPAKCLSRSRRTAMRPAVTVTLVE